MRTEKASRMGMAWVREAREQFTADSDAERKRLVKLPIEVEKLTSRIERFAPGSSDFTSLEGKISALKTEYETERERLAREFAEREARTMAGILKDIQEVVISVAKAKGLNYVDEVSPFPPTGADMLSALKRSVLYADPRNDVTEEVIRDLNRGFDAATAKTPR